MYYLICTSSKPRHMLIIKYSPKICNSFLWKSGRNFHSPLAGAFRACLKIAGTANFYPEEGIFKEKTASRAARTARASSGQKTAFPMFQASPGLCVKAGETLELWPGARGSRKTPRKAAAFPEPLTAKSIFLVKTDCIPAFYNRLYGPGNTRAFDAEQWTGSGISQKRPL